MTQSLTIGTSGGNKDASEIWVGTSGGNKQVTEGWVGTASGNKQFYSYTSAQLFTGTSYISDPGNSIVINLTSAGDFTQDGYGTWYSWLLSGLASNCELKVELVSGTSPAGSALSTWLPLSGTRSYVLFVAGQTCTLSMQIRNASTLAILASAASITLTAI